MTSQFKWRVRATAALVAVCLVVILSLFVADTLRGRIWLRESRIDVGVVRAGDTGEAKFVVESSCRNATRISVKSSSDDATFNSYDDVVSSHKPASIRVGWLCKQRHTGAKSWRLVITTTDKRNSETELVVTASVI